MDIYNNQEHMKSISQSDLRAQLEVIIKLYYELFNSNKMLNYICLIETYLPQCFIFSGNLFLLMCLVNGSNS